MNKINKYKWEIKLSVFLIVLSFLLYLVQFLTFGHLDKIYENIIGQLAFLPIYVLLVTIVIEQLLERKEKDNKKQKMNVVVGVFFSEIGRELLVKLLGYDGNANEIINSCSFIEESFNKSSKDVLKSLNRYKSKIETNAYILKDLKVFMMKNRDFLIRTVQNPNLYEHESFTELILAVFHLYEELSKRDVLEDLPKEEYDHLSNDLEIAFTKIVFEWLYYMRNLKKEYPYLFAIELRDNPFIEAYSLKKVL